jgi:hypothetical protein
MPLHKSQKFVYDGTVRRARLKHGLYSAEALAEQKRARELLAQSRELLKQMQAG